MLINYYCESLSHCKVLWGLGSRPKTAASAGHCLKLGSGKPASSTSMSIYVAAKKEGSDFWQLRVTWTRIDHCSLPFRNISKMSNDGNMFANIDKKGTAPPQHSLHCVKIPALVPWQMEAKDNIHWGPWWVFWTCWYGVGLVRADVNAKMDTLILDSAKGSKW